MKRLVFILLLCLQALTGWAATQSETDSLQQVLLTLPHDSTRLHLLKKMAQIEQMNPKCILFADMLAKEATFQKSDKFNNIAAYLHIVYYYNQSKQDSVQKWLAVMEPYARKIKEWDLYFDALRFEIDLYSHQEQFELAINEATEMYRKAKEVNCIRGLIGANQCQANAYISTGRWEEGEQALQNAHKLLPQISNKVVHISVLCQLIGTAKETKNNKHLIKYLRELETTLRQHTTDNPLLKKAFYDVYIFNEIYYAYYYLRIDQPQQAHEHLKKADKYLNANTFFMYQVLYYDVYADYYRHLKEYDKALACIDSTTVRLKGVALENNHANQLLVKADILAEAGRSHEALPIYEAVLEAKDSIEKNISDKQMDQIKSTYNIDKIMLEEEQLKNEIQLTALAVVVVVLILLTTFMLRISHVRKALKISESETRKTTQKAEEANKMKNRFLSNMSHNIRVPLNGVVGFSQLIATEPDIDEKTRKEYSSIIQKNSEELLHLVNDILDLSRLEAGMMKFQIQEYDVIPLCNDAICMASMQNNGYVDVEFVTEIAEQSIHTDTSRLIQTILSMLTYPQPCSSVKRKIVFTLTHEAQTKMLCFHIVNSPLADPAFESQEVSIRHQINQLLVEHFGGTYTLLADTAEGPVLVFTYPA